MLGPITPSLWFDFGVAERAAEFYCAIFPNSRIVSMTRYPDGAPDHAGEVLTVVWELDGSRFMGLNAGPQFTFDEAVSFMITCADQAEVDFFWERLLADGGTESMCGWLTDQFGVSWQVVPDGLTDVLGDPDPERSQRAVAAMLQMRKLDLDALWRAADGEG